MRNDRTTFHVASDELTDQLRAELENTWPGVDFDLREQPSKSVVGQRMFVLQWRPGPLMQDVRAWLDRRWPHIGVFLNEIREET